MMVEVFRGSPYKDQVSLEEWTARLTRNRIKETIAVAVGLISCQQARKIMENEADLEERDLQTALVHITFCWESGCREIRHQFVRDQLKRLARERSKVS